MTMELDDDALFSKIQDAQNLLGLDQTDVKYYSFFFLALRAVGLSLKDTVRVIQGELRNNANGEVSYEHLYADMPAVAHIWQESGEHSLRIPSLRDVNKKIGNNLKPKSKLGQLVWIETIIRCPDSLEEFSKELKLVKEEIVNPYGG